jgi:hypothetical protein
MFVVLAQVVVAQEATAEPVHDLAWSLDFHSSTVAQSLSRSAGGANDLLTTYYQAKGRWDWLAWLGLQWEFEGGQVIGHPQDTHLGVNLGTQWRTNEMQEDSRGYVPVLALVGTTPTQCVSWKLGKISPEGCLDDNRIAHAKRTRFLSFPLCRNAAVPFAAKGLGGTVTWNADPHASVTVLASDANARETLSGFTTWRGDWFTAAEVTLRPLARPDAVALRLLGWSTTRLGRRDTGCGISADFEITPRLVAFVRLGTGSRYFARSHQLLSLGLGWDAPFGHRGDFLGVGVAQGNSVTPGTRTEILAEVVYRWQVSRFLALSPDLQYVHHPALSTLSSSLVTGLRCAVSF